MSQSVFVLYVREFSFVGEGAGGGTGENRVSSQNCSQEPQVQYKSSWEGRERKKRTYALSAFWGGW